MTYKGSSPFSRVRRYVRTLVAALMLIALMIIVKRAGLDPAGIVSRSSTIPTGSLLLVVVGAPLLWIAYEFIYASVEEAILQARESGSKFGKSIGPATSAVLARALDRLSAYATRRSFEGRYRQRLLEDFGLFNDRGLGLVNAARIDLENVYVDLMISQAAGKSRQELLSRKIQGRSSIWEALNLVRIGCGLALIGPPGSGKSTLMQHVLLVFAANKQGRYRQRRRLPVLIELRTMKDDFLSSEPKSLVPFVRQYWRTHSRLADLMKLEPDGWLERKFSSGGIVLLLDGLDEVPMSTRKTLSQWLHRQMKAESQRECSFVLSSRPAGYAEAPVLDATVLELQPFTKPQSDLFIDRWYLANEIVASGVSRADSQIVRRARVEADELRRRLQANPSLDDLTVNPLLLTMLCMVHRYHGVLPGSRSQLYAEICQVLLERWRQAKDIEDDLRGDQKLAVLRPLADAFMRGNVTEMSAEEVIVLLTEPLDDIGYAQRVGNNPGAEFLSYMQSSSGLLLEKEAGKWSFAHKTFQEFLAAEFWYLIPSSRPAWQTVVGDDWWSEAVLLYASRADASEIVTEALERETPSSWALAFRCLTEAQSIKKDVRERGEAALRRALRSSDPLLFIPAARAFQHLMQSQTRRISDSLEQRAALISLAEYQLFLDERGDSDRTEFIPPHWQGDRFVGDPEDPVLGVWPWQAAAYVAYIGKGQSQGAWRLPRPEEEIVQSAGDVICWRERAERRGRAPLERESIEGFSKDVIPGSLTRNSSLDRGVLDAVGLCLAERLNVEFHQRKEFGFTLTSSLGMVASYLYASDYGAAERRARIASFTTDRVQFFASVLLSDLRNVAAAAVVKPLSYGVTLATPDVKREEIEATIASALARVSLKKVQLNTPEDMTRDTVNSRIRLLRALVGVLGERDAHSRSGDRRLWSRARADWRRLGLSILELAAEKMEARKFDQIAEFLQVLQIVEARSCGARAREGIAIVRVRRRS